MYDLPEEAGLCFAFASHVTKPRQTENATPFTSCLMSVRGNICYLTCFSSRSAICYGCKDALSQSLLSLLIWRHNTLENERSVGIKSYV